MKISAEPPEITSKNPEFKFLSSRTNVTPTASAGTASISKTDVKKVIHKNKLSFRKPRFLFLEAKIVHTTFKLLIILEIPKI